MADDEQGGVAADTAADTAVDASSPVKGLQGTVRALLSVVAPTTLVVGLLFYFGWARTSAQAHALGLDDTLFGYSTQDYILNSVSSMYWPLFIGAIALLVGLLAHGLISAWLDDQELARRVHAARVIAFVSLGLGVLALILGAIGASVDRPTRFVSLAAPLSITVGIVLVAYAAHIWLRYVDRPTTTGYGAQVTRLAPLAWSVLAALLLLSLFWSVSHYAGVRGVDLALEAERRLALQPNVTIYSHDRLSLDEPVEEARLSDADAAYRFRYSGLKLLFRSQGNYFLRPTDPSDPRNIVIAEAPGLRFEFVR